MTEITITANGKPHYHYTANWILSQKEINEVIAEDESIYRKAGVKYEVNINQK